MRRNEGKCTASSTNDIQDPESGMPQPGGTDESEDGLEKNPERASAPHTDLPPYDDPSNNASHAIESVTVIILTNDGP